MKTTQKTWHNIQNWVLDFKFIVKLIYLREQDW